MLRSELTPERILVFGPEGSGKTHAWLTIAQLAEQTGSPTRFHVLDTDYNAVARMTEVGQFVGLKNLLVTTAYDWVDADKWAKELENAVSPGDWVVVDLIGTTWRWVQDKYIELIFGEEPADYFLRIRQVIQATKGEDMKGGLGALSIFKDWPVVNKLYGRFIANIYKAHRKGAHLFFTSSVDRLESSDDEETKKLFRGVGIKAAGEKTVAHKMHTVIYANYTPGVWTMTTLKDRGRPYWTGYRVTNFAVEYLIPNGWQA